MHSLADTFLLNNRVNLMLLDALTDEQLAHLPARRARSIVDQFAHLHNARLMWLEVSAPAAMKGLVKIEKGTGSRAGLQKSLEASASALAGMIDEAERSGKMRNYKRGITVFCGYILAHEGHHRGEIIVHLKHAKLPVDRDLTYRIWEWEKI